jgi:polysaccharide pyruvyl transferase WcaK-like protein
VPTPPSDPAGPALRVLLLGHSARSGNLGVGALTVAQVAILRDLARDRGLVPEITIAEGAGDLPAYVTGPDIRLAGLRGRDLVDPRRFLARVRRQHLVIDIGAGDSFADIYGPRRLRRMFLTQGLVLAARRPLVLAPQTIGPFSRPLSRLAARAVLGRAAVVASRDALSTAAAAALGRHEVVEASDVALRLPFDPPPPRPGGGAGGGAVRAGLNVSGLLMAGGYTRSNMFGLRADYPAVVRGILQGLAARGAAVTLVPHVLAPKGWAEDDHGPSEALAAEFPGVAVAPRFAGPSAAKSCIAGMDFFAGARMHACIAAFSAGVPVVPMAYSRKFAGLFGSLGYDRTVDCTTEETGTIVARVLAGFDDRARLAAEAAAALARGQERLARYEAALGALVDRVAGAGGR